MRLTTLFLLLATASPTLAQSGRGDIVHLPSEIQPGTQFTIILSGPKARLVDGLQFCHGMLESVKLTPMSNNHFRCVGPVRSMPRVVLPPSITAVEISIGDKLKITWTPRSYSVTVIGGSLCKPRKGRVSCKRWVKDMQELNDLAYRTCVAQNGRERCQRPPKLTTADCPCNKRAAPLPRRPATPRDY